MILKYFSSSGNNLAVYLKEFIIYIIINLSRVYKGFFEPTLNLLQHRITTNQRAHNMVYNSDDIKFALNMLEKTKSQRPLMIHFTDRDPSIDTQQQIEDHFRFADNFTTHVPFSNDNKSVSLRSNPLTLSRKTFSPRTLDRDQPIIKFLQIDFLTQNHMTMTICREFWDIFLTSIHRQMLLHFEILSGFYLYITIQIDQNKQPQQE